jgi:hypothetical protein
MAYQTIKWKNWRILFCLLGILATACEPVSTVSHPNSETCQPSANDANIYKEASEQYPDGLIFTEAFRTGQPYFDTDIRKKALYALKDEVRRWSSFQDILINNDQVVRITLTFMHPELVEIIYLNHALAQISTINKEHFANEIKSKLEVLAEYDELFFLVTVTNSSYKPLVTEKDVVILNISVQSITLMNSENKNVIPSRYDPPLDQNIKISQKHLSGYIVFPMYVKDKGDQCVLLLDPTSNTTITLGAPVIKLSNSSGNVSNHQLTWFIRYHSLLDIDTTPTPVIVHNQNISPECCHSPPTPDANKLPADEVYWDGYWVEMARYIWGYEVNP